MQHTFHIPVLGLGYSIDTPLKVARYGISSVVSIVDDELTERMRKHHAEKNGEPYEFISKAETDSRARRITAYLNLLNHLVSKQVIALKELSFEEKGNDLCTYFELLPEHSVLKAKYREMQQMPDSIEKLFCQKELKRQIKAGSIDVNIMSKVDKANFYQGQYLGDESTDALAAVRGFANSTLRSSVIISAGLNPRLFSYMEKIHDFFPSSEGVFTKKIILKVSDYRSALIQAKVLAKKGLWVSEFRIESGLNCGGHAFATEGFLLGPILEEFKENRTVLYNELHQLYTQAIILKNAGLSSCNPAQRITVQGGIGTAEEHRFLIQHFQLDSAGWGSPFLLVPEATNVDINTLNDLAASTESDFYLSHASPLGVPFNNFAKSTSEIQRLERIANGRPGSPCTKKFLCSNTEFTEQPICTASRKYQHLKIKQLQSLDMEETERTKQIDAVTEKVCLCEGLCASAYLTNNILKPRENKAVSICPGPNLAYFSKKYSLKEMIDHIYERCDLLVDVQRPNLFIKELGLYIDYLKKEFETLQDDLKKRNSLTRFYNQLQNGVSYYKAFIAKAEPSLSMWNTEQVQFFNNAVHKLLNLKIPYA